MDWNPLKQSVLVPMVKSAECLHAMEVAAQFVDDRRKIHAVHVVYPPSALAPAMIWENIDIHDLERRAAAAIRDDLDNAGFSSSQVHVRVGNPATSICEAADELGAELIVMPSHGRAGFERFLIGSVTEHVLRHCHCPVLVLKSSA